MVLQALYEEQALRHGLWLCPRRRHSNMAFGGGNLMTPTDAKRARAFLG